MTRRLTGTMCLSAFAFSAAMAQATSIDVLWTAGDTGYNADITTLATGADTYDPNGDGALSWNLTLWDGGAVDFAAYDVLVVGSACNVSTNGNCGGSGFFGTNVSVAGVLANKAGIEAARGNRTFLSGQDADWHYENSPGARDDGPRGFLINAVNWAASGTGLGIVSMVDRYINNDGWWTLEDSFLADELGDSVFAYQNQDVDIGDGQDTFPINEGLTSAGLSNWNTSSHSCLNAVDGYTAINIAGAGAFAGCGVTIVTSAGVDGGTDGGDDDDTVIEGEVPLPAAAWFMLAGLAGLFGLRRRRT